MQTAIRHSEVKTEFCTGKHTYDLLDLTFKLNFQVLLNRFWGLPRDPENTFELSNNKWPLSATVS